MSKENHNETEPCCVDTGSLPNLSDRLQNDLNYHLDRAAEINKCIRLLDNDPGFAKKMEEFDKALGRY